VSCLTWSDVQESFLFVMNVCDLGYQVESCCGEVYFGGVVFLPMGNKSLANLKIVLVFNLLTIVFQLEISIEILIACVSIRIGFVTVTETTFYEYASTAIQNETLIWIN